MSVKKWKLLDSEYLFKRPWLTARRDRVQLPDGTVHPEFYILEYPDWVNIIAITTDGRYVMIEQYRHGLQEVLTELVAGCVEPGEDPMDAARRELLEETGFGGGCWTPLAVLSPNASANTNLTYSYLAVGVEKISEQHLDTTEDIAIKLMSESEIREMLLSDQMKQAQMAAPLWKYIALKDAGK